MDVDAGCGFAAVAGEDEAGRAEAGAGPGGGGGCFLTVDGEVSTAIIIDQTGMSALAQRDASREE